MAIPKETKKQQPPPKPTVNSASSSWADRVKWSRSMVGFFPGFRMNFHHVNKIASRVWKSNGLESVTTTTPGFMIFRFKKKDQMLDILERGPWLFGGKAIILQISKLPVWIRLHGLPFPLWSRKGLSLVASMVGRPLSCNESTFSCSRLDLARVWVEIDASIPLVHKFEIVTPLSPEPLHIEVEYEWAGLNGPNKQKIVRDWILKSKLKIAQLQSPPYRGLKYTWHNGQSNQRMILKKLDWVVGNYAFTVGWPSAEVNFLPRSAFNHSAMILKLQGNQPPPPSISVQIP
ncbi:DUF4283 domain-containing protein [Salix suchowensis]|nr:DUF4283 domain-containing protein [Salix suchowensis]